MKSKSIYQVADNFMSKYPTTIGWRVKAHSKIIEKHLNPGEEVIYAFVGQKGPQFYELFYTGLVVLTNKRILVATKRFVWGYFFTSITPDMFNDLKVKVGLIWARVYIDTISEELIISNIDKAAAREIETAVTEQMMILKKRYGISAKKRK
jgi:hypothetical protein